MVIFAHFFRGGVLTASSHQNWWRGSINHINAQGKYTIMVEWKHLVKSGSVECHIKFTVMQKSKFIRLGDDNCVYNSWIFGINFIGLNIQSHNSSKQNGEIESSLAIVDTTMSSCNLIPEVLNWLNTFLNQTFNSTLYLKATFVTDQEPKTWCYTITLDNV